MAPPVHFIQAKLSDLVDDAGNEMKEIKSLLKNQDEYVNLKGRMEELESAALKASNEAAAAAAAPKVTAAQISALSAQVVRLESSVDAVKEAMDALQVLCVYGNRHNCCVVLYCRELLL